MPYKTRYHEEISGKNAFKHVEALCAFGPRHAATPNEHKAIEYIKNEFDSYKNLKTELEKTGPIVDWRQVDARLQIVSPIELELTCRAILGTGSTPEEGIRCELAYGGRGFRKDYEGQDLKNKIVLHDPPHALTLDNACAPGMPQRDLNYLNSLGVSGLIEYCRTPGKLISAPLLSGREGMDTPCVSLTYDDAIYLKQLLTQWYALPMGLIATERIPIILWMKTITERKPGSSYNVIATLPGRELPEEKVILLAHHDNAYGPGAVDNAASLAVVLEVAKALDTINPNNKRSIEFVTVSGEEYGQAGSGDYVANRLSSIDNVKGVIVLDICGGGDKYFYVEKSMWDGELVYNSKKINKMLEETCDGLGLDIQPTPLEFASDDAPFIKAGVETSYICRLISMSWPWLHTDLDTPRIVDIAALKVLSEMSINTLMRLANE